MRRNMFVLVLGICLIGFVADVVAWAREGNHGVLEILGEYWWAVLFIVAYAVEFLIKRPGRHKGDSG